MASTLPLTGNGDITINSTPANGLIKLVDANSGNGNILTIQGANAAAGNNNGGNIIISPGTKTGTGTDGMVGISTTNPLSTLDVKGNVRFGWDNAASNAGSAIIMVPSPTGISSIDGQNIQAAIDQAGYNGGGTVILQKGKYVVNKAAGGDYAILLKGGVRLCGCSCGSNSNSGNGTEIQVNSTRSIVVLKVEDTPGLKFGIIVKDILFTTSENYKHVAVGLFRTQMAKLDNLNIVNFLIGIQITNWVNQINNCQTIGCGIGIQLNGTPQVRDVTITGSQSSPLQVSVIDVSRIRVGQYFWNNGKTMKWLITAINSLTLSLEDVDGNGNTPASSGTGHISYCDSDFRGTIRVAGKTISSVNLGSSTVTLTDASNVSIGNFIWAPVTGYSGNDYYRWKITAIAGTVLTIADYDGNGVFPITGTANILYKNDNFFGSFQANSTMILGSHFISCLDYGAFIEGLQNALINSTIEANNSHNATNGIAIVTGSWLASFANSIISCYFEANSTHVNLGGSVIGTKIIGNFLAKADPGETWISYGTGTDSSGSGNSDIETISMYGGSNVTMPTSFIGGNVGIGTISPVFKLHINGGQLGVAPVPNYPGVMTVLPSGNGNWWNIANTNNGSKLMLATGNKGAANDTSDWNSSLLTILDSGALGIGTASPVFKLHINGGQLGVAPVTNYPGVITVLPSSTGYWWYPFG